jgi:3D (Asp-Asp-Asp) domain-containing protein
MTPATPTKQSSTVTAGCNHTQRKRGVVWVVPVGGLLVLLAPVVLLAGAGNPPCTTLGVSPAGSGGWVATAYGPPWGGIQGGGITATGINLTAGEPAYEIAVDPAVIPLRTFVHVTPNPYGTGHAFYAGDTGGAIIGRHIDIYDWHGRAAQDAWGKRHVTVTPAAAPGAGNLLGQITPTPSPATTTTPTTGGAGCPDTGTGPLALTAGQTARVLPDGEAAAPADAPARVKLAIAAGNEIIDKPYPVPDVHYGPLAELWPAYDCSATVSYVLYKLGLLPVAEDSGELETYGKPGAGRWITVYATTGHTWIVIAGLALDTSSTGNPESWTPPGTGPRWRPDPTGNLADGWTYVTRHPQGL